MRWACKWFRELPSQPVSCTIPPSGSSPRLTRPRDHPFLQPVEAAALREPPPLVAPALPTDLGLYNVRGVPIYESPSLGREEHRERLAFARPFLRTCGLDRLPNNR